MARTFTSASSEKITLNLGAGASITGAVTLAAIVKRATNGVAHGLVSIGTSTVTQRSLILSNTNIVGLRSGNALQSSTTTVQIADGWCFVCATKAAGTATPRFHIYKAAGTWAHENAAGTLTDSTPATNSLLGTSTGAAAFLNGDLAVAGAYAVALTDSQVEAMAFDLTAWWQVQPNGLWVLDQAAVGTLVNDWSGGGAGQSAIVGTTVSTSSVPTFSYGASIITETAAFNQTLALSPATITLTPVALGITAGAASVALTAAVITLTPVALGITAGGGDQTIALSPATITVTPVALTVTPGAVALLLGRVQVTVTPVALTVTAGAATLTLTAATIAVTAVALGISVGGAPQTVALTAATITVTPVALGITVLIADPNALTLTLYTTGGTLTLDAVGHTLTVAGRPQSLTIDDEGHTGSAREWAQTVTRKE